MHYAHLQKNQGKKIIFRQSLRKKTITRKQGQTVITELAGKMAKPLAINHTSVTKS